MDIGRKWRKGTWEETWDGRMADGFSCSVRSNHVRQEARIQETELKLDLS